MNKIKGFMSTGTNRGTIPRTASIFQAYAKRLREYFTQRYATSISFVDLLRTRQEYKTIKSIQQKLHQYQLVLRRSDKSGVTHIGHAADYERKAIDYRTRTGAYMELPSNPYNDILQKVTRTLHNLGITGKITQTQKQNMMPVRKDTELAYMYFIPKSHKVIIDSFIFLSVSIFPYITMILLCSI